MNNQELVIIFGYTHTRAKHSWKSLLFSIYVVKLILERYLKMSRFCPSTKQNLPRIVNTWKARKSSGVSKNVVIFNTKSRFNIILYNSNYTLSTARREGSFATLPGILAKTSKYIFRRSHLVGETKSFESRIVRERCKRTTETKIRR